MVERFIGVVVLETLAALRSPCDCFLHRKTCDQHRADKECGNTFMKGHCCETCHECSQECLATELAGEPTTTGVVTLECTDEPPEGAPYV